MSNSNIGMKRTFQRGPQAALAAAACAVAIGCGGSSAKSGLGETKPPPPPSVAGAAGDKKPTRDISSDARKDYTAAIEAFKKHETSGWSSSACESSAERFASVADDHPKLVEARYMAGLSYHRCQMAKQAEAEYQRALKADGSHAPSMANLGELYFAAGKAESAKQYWETAVKVDSKVVAARVNLAWLILEQMRKTKDKKAWGKLEEEAKFHLSSALAVDNDNVKTYVLYALLYMEGAERNKSRLDLAKLLLDEGAKRDGKYAALYNARGLLQMQRNNQGDALSNFQKAVELDPNFVEARMNVGNLTLGFRKYDVAEEQFTSVLKLRPRDYDATIGLGIAQRALGKLDEAEASYKKASEIDGSKGAAYFNLGVLYKDFRANKAEDLKKSQQAYGTARKYFETYMSKADATDDGKKEAKDNIADCEKIIKQLDEVIAATAQEGQGGGQ